MAFLEQLGKRLSDAGQGAAQQAKNFTDVTRLNSAISDKEKKITQLYASIGQAYYQRHRSDPDAEELQQIEAVNALFAEIAQCQEEIKQIKGVSKCPSCGAGGGAGRDRAGAPSGGQPPVSQLSRPCPGGKPILHLLRCQTRVR